MSFVFDYYVVLWSCISTSRSILWTYVCQVCFLKTMDDSWVCFIFFCKDDCWVCFIYEIWMIVGLLIIYGCLLGLFIFLFYNDDCWVRCLWNMDDCRVCLVIIYGWLVGLHFYFIRMIVGLGIYEVVEVVGFALL